MSLAELLLILLIALVVFGPNKLPMLAQHIGQMLALYQRYKQKTTDFIQTQYQQEQLHQNRKKAQQADLSYATDNTPNKPHSSG